LSAGHFRALSLFLRAPRVASLVVSRAHGRQLLGEASEVVHERAAIGRSSRHAGESPRVSRTVMTTPAGPLAYAMRLASERIDRMAEPCRPMTWRTARGVEAMSM
jgi:hypothetical protein